MRHANRSILPDHSVPVVPNNQAETTDVAASSLPLRHAPPRRLEFTPFTALQSAPRVGSSPTLTTPLPPTFVPRPKADRVCFPYSRYVLAGLRIAQNTMLSITGALPESKFVRVRTCNHMLLQDKTVQAVVTGALSLTLTRQHCGAQKPTSASAHHPEQGRYYHFDTFQSTPFLHFQDWGEKHVRPFCLDAAFCRLWHRTGGLRARCGLGGQVLSGPWGRVRGLSTGVSRQGGFPHRFPGYPLDFRRPFRRTPACHRRPLTMTLSSGCAPAASESAILPHARELSPWRANMMAHQAPLT